MKIQSVNAIASLDAICTNGYYYVYFKCVRTRSNIETIINSLVVPFTILAAATQPHNNTKTIFTDNGF